MGMIMFARKPIHMMKKLLLNLMILMAAGTLSAAVKNGEMAPGFTLTSMNGEEVSLSDYAGKTIVLEWINPGCPFVKKFYTNGDMGKFQKKAKGMDVVWLAINSTNPDHRDYLTPAESRSWAGKHDFQATWLMDPDGEVGQAYGARTTPHMYIIDGSGKIVYQGAIDSIRDVKPESISEATNYVMNALKALMDGKEIPDAQTRPYGCSVKYAG